MPRRPPVATMPVGFVPPVPRAQRAVRTCRRRPAISRTSSRPRLSRCARCPSFRRRPAITPRRRPPRHARARRRGRSPPARSAWSASAPRSPPRAATGARRRTRWCASRRRAGPAPGFFIDGPDRVRLRRDREPRRRSRRARARRARRRHRQGCVRRGVSGDRDRRDGSRCRPRDHPDQERRCERGSRSSRSRRSRRRTREILSYGYPGSSLATHAGLSRKDGKVLSLVSFPAYDERYARVLRDNAVDGLLDLDARSSPACRAARRSTTPARSSAST